MHVIGMAYMAYMAYMALTSTGSHWVEWQPWEKLLRLISLRQTNGDGGQSGGCGRHQVDTTANPFDLWAGCPNARQAGWQSELRLVGTEAHDLTVPPCIIFR
jgi:hypothetical protein